MRTSGRRDSAGADADDADLADAPLRVGEFAVDGVEGDRPRLAAPLPGGGLASACSTGCAMIQRETVGRLGIDGS